MPTDISFEPLPLVVGVTGHRDLREEDIPRLREELEAIFDKLEDDYANPVSGLEKLLRRFWPGQADWLKDRRRKRPGATPMIVLSALAEGADQLVAQVALDRGLQVIAPLPLLEEEYRRDFEPPQAIRPDAAATFDKWMGHPGVQKLFVGYEKFLTADDVKIFGAKRNLQYRRAGAFIARHCDVLIALWDGKTGDGAATGGTAEIVNFKTHGIPLDASHSGRASLDAPEIGPVIQIVTPRMKAPPSEKMSVVRWGFRTAWQVLSDALRRSSSSNAEIEALEHEYSRWKYFRASSRQTGTFNREAARLLQSSDGHDKIEKSVSYLFEVDEKKPATGATAGRARDAARHYCDLYAVADILAQRWQRIFVNDWRWLFTLGLFAFGCFEAYSHLVPVIRHMLPDVQLVGKELNWIIDRALLIGYVAAFIGIFILAYVAKLREHQERFLDYRALAEALRVAVFWRLAGIEHAADAYPIKMPQELAWVKTCLLGQELLDKATPERRAGPAWRSKGDYGWFCDTWVDGQRRYFVKSGLKHFWSAEWRNTSSKWILVAIAALATVLLGVVLYVAGNDEFGPVSEWLSRDEWAHDLFLFTIGVLPGFAAFFVGHSEKLAFDAQARQYDRMAAVFIQAFRILPRAIDQGNDEMVLDALRELGAEAMRENAEWVATYRQRPIGPTQP